jgi:integrase
MGIQEHHKGDHPRRKNPITLRTLSSDETLSFVRVAKEADPKWHLFFSLALTTGMRIGELRDLRWGDVHLANGKINVRHHQFWTIEQFQIEIDKPLHYSREVPLGKKTIELLRVYKARQTPNQECAKGSSASDLVFSDVSGTPLSISLIGATFKTLCKAAGVAPTSFHVLRNTTCILMCSCCLNPEAVGYLLGNRVLNPKCHISGLQAQYLKDITKAMVFMDNYVIQTEQPKS